MINNIETKIGRAAEQVFYKVVGIKPESEGIKWYSVIFFELTSKIDRLIHLTTYTGTHLPLEGPAFLISNHTSLWDPPKGYRVGQRSHRIPRTYTRESFLDPTKKDSAEVLARTGHKSDILNSGPMWFRRLLAAFPKGVEAIPVARGGDTEDGVDFLAQGKEKFAAKQIVAGFVQETRNKDGKLVDPKRGMALLARDNPDVPIYPMGISQIDLPLIPWIKRHRVSVGEPFTYKNLLKDPAYASLPRTQLIVAMVDRIANQLDPMHKQDWYKVQRPLILARRKTSKFSTN